MSMKKLSIIIPVFNEKNNISKLASLITQALQSLNIGYEVIWVDDGSVDGSHYILRQIQQSYDHHKVIYFSRNYGQTAAMAAGIKAASGEIIAPLDADLQNDPADIPYMLNIYKQGYDVVSGWRKSRKDGAIHMVFSYVANRIISHITGISLHDFGCSLKLYNAKKLKKICLHGEMHRFIPALMSRYGIKIIEVPVQSHARVYGKSKYSLNRTFRVLLDLGTIMLHTKFMDKPLYFFGYISICAFALAFALALSATLLFQNQHVVAITMFLLAMCIGIISTIWLGFGFLAEMLIMLRLRTSTENTYCIEDIAANIMK